MLNKCGTAVLAHLSASGLAACRQPRRCWAVNWFNDNLELSREAFDAKAKEAGASSAGVVGDNLYLDSRRSAMRARLDQELDKAPASEAQLIARLLPHTDPAVDSPLLRTLRDQLAFFARPMRSTVSGTSSTDRAASRIWCPRHHPRPHV